jgi:hypothetical protein
MKTYIVFTTKGIVATIANSKKAAFEKVQSSLKDAIALKSNITISSCHLDYCTCDKIN